MIVRSILLIASLAQLANAQALQKRPDKPIPPTVENVYKKGLRYLATSQKEDGSWSDQGYGASTGVIGLAIMAFLAHGEDPNFGPYSKNIKRSINYMIKHQRQSDGFLVNKAGRGSMYNHGFATLALAECYGMCRDPRVGTALKKAVKLSLDAQASNPMGGWRYDPGGTTSDTSIAGCVLVSLYAARNAGIPVPDEALSKGLKFMRKCRDAKGVYSYTPGFGRKRNTFTAIGQLCEALAKGHETPGFKKTQAYLGQNINYMDDKAPFYYKYYASQAFFHTNEDLFEQWNKRNIRYLSSIQANDGSFPSGGMAGPTFNTAASLLSLALNYRLLPIYEK